MWKPVGQRSRPGSACSPGNPHRVARSRCGHTDAPIIDFLTLGTRTGKLGWVASDGRPLVAVWFVVEGDDLLFNTGAGTAKGKALARDPRVVLTVDLEEPPYGFVQLQGVAEVTEELVEVRRMRRSTDTWERIAEEFGARNGVPGELGVRVHLSKVVADLDMTASGVTGPTPSVLVRDARPDDWAAIWPFLRVVISAGETFTWDRDTDDPRPVACGCADRPA